MWALLFASDFTAIPVNPGSPDYYDGSVTMLNIQRHLPWFYPWDLSPFGITHSHDWHFSLGNPRLGHYDEICSVVGMGFSSFTIADGRLVQNTLRVADSKIQSAWTPTYHLPFRWGDG